MIFVVVQWCSVDGSFEVIVQFFWVFYENVWSECVVELSIDSGLIIILVAGISFEFGDDGLFESGVIFESVGWCLNDLIYLFNGVCQLVLI